MYTYKGYQSHSLERNQFEFESLISLSCVCNRTDQYSVISVILTALENRVYSQGYLFGLLVIYFTPKNI
jgi:hypothetical protein